MRPAMSGAGDEAGWRTLTDVRISDAEISGTFSYNWVNRPVVRIDRMTGEVQVRQASLVSGRSSFSGMCEPASQERRF